MHMHFAPPIVIDVASQPTGLEPGRRRAKFAGRMVKAAGKSFIGSACPATVCCTNVHAPGQSTSCGERPVPSGIMLMRYHSIRLHLCGDCKYIYCKDNSTREMHCYHHLWKFVYSSRL